MRFLLYNIRYGTGKYLNQPLRHMRGYLGQTLDHIHRIGEFIRGYNPDIVGLVEVDLGSFRTKEANQAKLLGDILGQNFVSQYKYEENSRYMKVPMLRKQGNAVLSRKEIIRQEFHYLDNGMKKLIIEADTGVVVVFIVHLALGGKTRLKQIVQLYDLIKRCKKPFIVAGDFNVLWGNEEIELFLKASELENVNYMNRPTFPSWNPKKELDFILYSKEIRLTDYKVIKTTLSDHLPILMDFEIIKRK